jgi:hypothetical protein
MLLGTNHVICFDRLNTPPAGFFLSCIIFYYQYFTKGLCSGDFPGTARQGRCSRFLAKRLLQINN